MEIRPIRLSETCQNICGQVKCPYGYPADKSSFYCNLKLGLLKTLQEETAGTSHADIDHDDVSLAGVLSCWRAARCSTLQHAVGRAVCYYPSVRAPLLGDNTRFSNPWASRGGSCLLQTAHSCASSNRLLGSM